MIPAPYHSDDKHIRETLYKLNILDTPLEERFDRVTRLACTILGVPISAFTLIDGERQWFKSIQGLDVTENTRPVSFCAYTILGDDVMVVPDTRKDQRFSGSPLVKGDPNITFYAGCPVRAPDGRNIGSLCAIDNKTRELTPAQIQSLRDLAQMIESELKVAQLSKSQYDLINELDAAHRLTLIDPLTRVWNQSGMDDLLKREWAMGLRKKSPLCLLMTEIDDLDRITVTHGRTSAELVIKEMAKRFLATLRAEDAIARIDNGKFLILLTDCSEDRLRETTDRIRETVTSKPVTLEDHFPVTMSFGATTLVPNISFEINDLIDSSEKALQLARDNGRNRTEIVIPD